MPTQNSAGKLKYAPLVLTLASVQIQPVKNMEKYIPEIQDELRDEYPEIVARSIQKRSYSDDAPPEITYEIDSWQLATAKRDWVVIIGRTNVTLATSANYEHFSSFAERFSDVLEKVSRIARLKSYRRFGLRQIDNISPFGEHGIDELVDSRFQPPKELDDFTSDFSQTEVHYRTEIGRLVLRALYSYRESSIPSVPENLQPLLVSLLSPIEQKKVNEVVLLDIDHFVEYGELTELNLENMKEQLQMLHIGARDLFFNAVTPDARKLWKGEEA